MKTPQWKLWYGAALIVFVVAALAFPVWFLMHDKVTVIEFYPYECTNADTGEERDRQWISQLWINKVQFPQIHNVHEQEYIVTCQRTDWR